MKIDIDVILEWLRDDCPIGMQERLIAADELERLGRVVAQQTRGTWAVHTQPADCRADHAYSIWFHSDDEQHSAPVILANTIPGDEDKLQLLVDLANAAPPAPHAALREAIEAERSYWIRNSVGSICRDINASFDRLIAALQPEAPAPDDDCSCGGGDISGHDSLCPEVHSGQMKGGIYIASKVKHADRWRFLRDKVGEPIISTWIDEAGEGKTSDFNDLWERCLTEAANCAVLIAYREPDETLKGAWVEIGAALTAGTPVFAVGIEEYTIAKYRGITHFRTMKEAIAASRAFLKASPTSNSPGGSAE